MGEQCVLCLCYTQGPFVAAFAQSNEGDVSPNTKGPHCLDSGVPCDILHSTCHGKVKGRVGARRVGGATFVGGTRGKSSGTRIMGD